MKNSKDSQEQFEAKSWLQMKLQEAGHGTGKALADFSGISATKISRMANLDPEKPTRRIKFEELLRFIEFFNDAPPGLERMIPNDNSRLPRERSNAIMTSVSPVGGTMVPLYCTDVGGAHGEFELRQQRLDEIQGAPSLAPIRGAYAVRIYGDYMEPRYFDGETVFVNPEKRPTKGEFVVAHVMGVGDDLDKTMLFVGRLVRRDFDELVIEQLGPPSRPVEERILSFEGDKVIHVHYILRSGE